MASAAPPVRFPNVYGIDMPTSDELVAHGRTNRGDPPDHRLRCADLPGSRWHEEGRSARSTPELASFDASCFDGVYVTGDITADDIARLNEKRPPRLKRARKTARASRFPIPSN
jgi:amidophosphoribosyltransferase